jgi:hypothetical protein
MAWYTLFKGNTVLFDGKLPKSIIMQKYSWVEPSKGKKVRLFKGKNVGRLVMEKKEL